MGNQAEDSMERAFVTIFIAVVIGVAAAAAIGGLVWLVKHFL